MIKEPEQTVPPSPTHTRKSSVAAQIPEVVASSGRSNVASPAPSQNANPSVPTQSQSQIQARRSTARDTTADAQTNGSPASEQGYLPTPSQPPPPLLPSNIPLPPRLRSQTSPSLIHPPLEPSISNSSQDGNLGPPTITASHSQPIVRPVSPISVSVSNATGTFSGAAQAANTSPEDYVGTQEPFNYAMTVNALTEQFLGEHEDTRIAALKWLIMLHQKNPKKESNSHL